MEPNTEYYYRAYVIVGEDYRYGDIKSFRTKRAEDNSAPDHIEAVDLGLSVKWASCNFAAGAPEDFGGYYAWGEMKEKDNCAMDTYLYFSNGEWVNIGSSISGTEYDIAHVKWGNGWRMPTQKEFEELRKDMYHALEPEDVVPNFKYRPDDVDAFYNYVNN